MNQSAIEVSHVIKRYDQKNVVDGVQFQIQRGECFGLLGPNGAGKTSLMRMMYGASRLSAGELRVLGFDIKSDSTKVKSKIGVVPQEDGLDPDFTVIENLLVFARYYGIDQKTAKSRALELLEVTGLLEKQNSYIPTLSGGMKRRLCVARALLNDPEILFLDEPTTGLDPQARQFIWTKIRELKRQGKTVVLTTHYMDEAEQLCDRIAIMEAGRIFSIGTPKDLIETHVGVEVVEFDYHKEDMSFIESKFEGKYDIQILDDRVRLFIKKGQDGKSVIGLISSDSMTVRRATMEDVFIRITGHQLRD